MIVPLRSAGFASVVGLALVLNAGCASNSSNTQGGKAAPGAAVVPAHSPQDFAVSGIFVETCTCDAPCGCEMIGLEMGCQGVGALQLSSGSYMGSDLAGIKIVYAMVPGEWVRLYIDAKPEQRKAAEALGRAVYTPFGTIEAVKAAKIDLRGSAGAYSVSVDDGKIATYQTQPVLGADKKTAVGHTNINDTLNTTLYQGKGASCTFHDEGRKFHIDAGTNAFFNDHMNASGKI
jgi:hypothetical protein